MESINKTNRRLRKAHKDSKKRYVLALDVGGTSLKSAFINSDGLILKKTFKKRTVNSQGSAETIIKTFSQVIKLSLRTAKKLELDVAGIGIGICGPFDYEKGISLMKRDKFTKIYGLNLKQELTKNLPMGKHLPIHFKHDVRAFLQGEVCSGMYRNYDHIIGITLGTGVGTAFMINNQIVTRGPGVLPHAIGLLPYKKGFVEDKIGRSALITRYRELAKKDCAENLDLDVKEIASRGLKDRDKISLQVFEELGSFLGQILKPIISGFGAECLILGGQISKSFPLFAEPLRKQLQSVPTLKRVFRARRIDTGTLYGVAQLIFQDMKSSVNNSKVDPICHI